VNDIDFKSEIWDGQFIEIYIESSHNTTKTIILGNLYRPPRPTVMNINTFIDELDLVCSNLINSKHVVITGDFNLDLLKYKENNLINKFLDSMISNSYVPKITLPTRLTNRQGSLIDNYFVKISKEFSETTAGIILNDISDHLPYFICLDYLNLKNKQNKYVEVLPPFAENALKLKTELSQPNIQESLSTISDDPNSSYKNIHDNLTKLVDKYFPTTLVRFNKYKHKKSKGILKSIHFREKLYKKLKCIANDDIELP